jgi:hypothetical protein
MSQSVSPSDLGAPLAAGGKDRRATIEAAAALVEMIKMSDVLMALGELNAEERRIVRALLPWLANRIRKL